MRSKQESLVGVPLVELEIFILCTLLVLRSVLD